MQATDSPHRNEQPRHIRSFPTVLAGIAAVLIVASTLGAPTASAAENQPTVEGVWRVTRHGVNCQTGAQLSSFPAIMVCGIDISESLLSAARRHCAHRPWVEFRQADATAVPFPDRAFDAAISTQVLEYVRDVDAALAEIHRVLRPGGRVVIVDTDWDSIVWDSPNRERMSRILAAWEQHAADVHLPRTLARRLSQAGFRTQLQRVVPLFNPSYDPNTYSNRIIDLIVPFVSGRNGITRDEAEGWANELRQSGKHGSYFFSLNRYLFVAHKGK